MPQSTERPPPPCAHVEDIVSVRALRSVRQIPGRGFRGSRAAGTVVTYRAVDGMTIESLQRVIDCHLARNASLGHVVPELPNCPLVPPGVRARVSSTDDGFAVAIRTRNARVAREILSLARRLVPPAGNDTAPERESSS